MFTPSTCVYFKQTRVLEDPILRGQRRLASNSSQSNRVSLNFSSSFTRLFLILYVQCTFTLSVSLRSEKQQWNSPHSAFILIELCLSFFTLSRSFLLFSSWPPSRYCVWFKVLCYLIILCGSGGVDWRNKRKNVHSPLGSNKVTWHMSHCLSYASSLFFRCFVLCLYLALRSVEASCPNCPVCCCSLPFAWPGRTSTCLLCARARPETIASLLS